MDLRHCNKGNHEVPLDQFSKSSKNVDGLFSWCKSCMATYERERYKNGDKARKEKNRLLNLERNRDFIWEFLSNSSCADCGNSDNRVLQFDHIDPATKLYNVSDMMWSNGIEKIVTEISKCVVRCSNCHIIRTNDQFGFWKLSRLAEEK